MPVAAEMVPDSEAGERDGLAPDVGDLALDQQRPAVLAIRCQRIQTIHRGENTRPDGNIFARQPERITCAIPLFVVCADDRHNRIREFDFFQNLRAHQRMDLHLLEFFRRQLAGL